MKKKNVTIRNRKRKSAVKPNRKTVISRAARGRGGGHSSLAFCKKRGGANPYGKITYGVSEGQEGEASVFREAASCG